LDKPKLNFVIDVSMFLCLTAMAGLGWATLPGGQRSSLAGKTGGLSFA
jgi:hypothetical protein